ncbi:hypothetical protein K505DRAFT_326837, partial [Melanomma pulvis-pyrius CBS 109.77]
AIMAALGITPRARMSPEVNGRREQRNRLILEEIHGDTVEENVEDDDSLVKKEKENMSPPPVKASGKKARNKARKAAKNTAKHTR